VQCRVVTLRTERRKLDPRGLVLLRDSTKSCEPPVRRILAAEPRVGPFGLPGDRQEATLCSEPT